MSSITVLNTLFYHTQYDCFPLVFCGCVEILPVSIRLSISWLVFLPFAFEDEDAVYIHAGIDIEEDLSTQSRDVVWTNLNDLLELDPLHSRRTVMRKAN